MRSVIPDRDGEAVLWMRIFANAVRRNWASLHMTEEQSQAIDEAVSEFEEAYEKAITPATRTQRTVLDKNEARKEAVRVCRQFAAWIRTHPCITDVQRVSVGLKPCAKRRRRKQKQKPVEVG